MVIDLYKSRLMLLSGLIVNPSFETQYSLDKVGTVVAPTTRALTHFVFGDNPIFKN